jgi:hypothetical protein
MPKRKYAKRKYGRTRGRPATKRLRGKSRTVKVVKRQIGTSNRRIDRRFKAKKPGKRRTAWGSTYYEKRRNRSDKNPRKRI